MNLPEFPLSVSEALWLGLAISRDVPSGPVWLFGLLDPISQDDDIWRWGTSLISLPMYAGDIPEAGRDEARKSAYSLRKWYARTYEGRVFGSGGGRPPGAPKDIDYLQRVFNEAYDGLNGSHEYRPTQGALAVRIGTLLLRDNEKGLTKRTEFSQPRISDYLRSGWLRWPD
jgi:hypothetical protein